MKKGKFLKLLAWSRKWEAIPQDVHVEYEKKLMELVWKEVEEIAVKHETAVDGYITEQIINQIDLINTYWDIRKKELRKDHYSKYLI